MKQPPCSTDYWFARVLSSHSGEISGLEQEMLSTLKKEIPEMCSVTMERTCNLQCRHCLYRPEKSSEAISRRARLPEIILRAVKQLPGKSPRLLHEGRIIRPWHIEILSEAKRRRPELRIGLIDNGTFTRNLNEFKKHNLVLDWLDLSLDGPEPIHNAQRASATAYRDVINGLSHARAVTREQTDGGRVTALFTLTKLNHMSLKKTASVLFPSAKKPLVDQLHITTMAPTRAELVPLELQDFQEFWTQAREVYTRHGYSVQGNQRIFFRFYHHHELLKLAKVVGGNTIRRALTQNVRFAPGEIYFTLDNVPCIFFPLSLWPGEEFLIDADGSYRTAYSISHTLADLRRGKSSSNEDLRGFTVEQLTPDFDLRTLYRRCVEQWWQFRGRRYLSEEASVLQSF